LDGGVTALRGAKAGSAVLCDIIVPCTMENFWPNALPSGAIAPLFNTGGLLNTLTVYGVVASRRLHSWLVRCGKDIRRQGGYGGGYSRGGGGGVKRNTSNCSLCAGGFDEEFD
jgi:hypothetical protein